MENVVGRDGEHAAEPERQVQARDVAIALDRVNALPGYTDGVCKLLLGPAASVSKLFHTITDRQIDKLTLQSARESVKSACHSGESHQLTRIITSPACSFPSSLCSGLRTVDSSIKQRWKTVLCVAKLRKFDEPVD